MKELKKGKLKIKCLPPTLENVSWGTHKKCKITLQKFDWIVKINPEKRGGGMKKGIEEIKEVLRELKNVIEEKYHAEVIGIFGSFARGEDGENSDIDLLVRFSDEATLLDLVGLSIFLEEKLGKKVDIVSERALRKEIAPYVMKDMVRI